MFIAISANANPIGSSSLFLSVNDRGNFIFVVNGITYPTCNGTVILDRVVDRIYDVKLYRVQHINKGYGSSFHNIFMNEDVIKVPCHTQVDALFGRYGVRINQRVIPMSNCRHTDKPKRGPVHCQVSGMNPDAFAALIGNLNNSGFDNTKVNIVKAALFSNQMTTAQIAAVLRTFTFDHYKLDVAKMAYNKCVDQQNFYVLASEFTFESNSRELMKYIS